MMRLAVVLAVCACGSRDPAPTDRFVRPPAERSIDASATAVETTPEPSRSAAFPLALALAPFVYGSISVNATKITNWDQTPQQMIATAIGLYEGENPVQEPLADGFDVRYTSRDGTKSGFVIRTLAGMNLECHPSSLDPSEEALHRDMCLRLTADAGKLVVPLSFGNERSVSVGHMFQPRRGSDLVGAHVSLSIAREDSPTAVPAGSKVVESHNVPGGFAVVFPGTSSLGTPGYEILSRQAIGGLVVVCDSFAADRAQAKLALALCTALHAP